jgi:hypothetical protein
MSKKEENEEAAQASQPIAQGMALYELLHRAARSIARQRYEKANSEPSSNQWRGTANHPSGSVSPADPFAE